MTVLDIARPVHSGASATTRRLVVVDSQPLIVEGILGCLRSSIADHEIIYAGSSVRTAVDAAVDAGCDGAIVGVGSGGSTTEAITAFALYGIPTLVLEDRASVAGMEAAFIAGARGYVGKDVAPADFARALQAVLSGQIPPMIEAKRSRTTVSLSEQERRALVLYASGMKQQMVARRMGIAPSTVKHYLDRVRAKYTEAGLRARTKLELHEVARLEGLLP